MIFLRDEYDPNADAITPTAITMQQSVICKGKKEKKREEDKKIMP